MRRFARIRVQLQRAYNVRLHQWLGVMIVCLGVTFQVTPGFAFSGQLLAASAALAQAYGWPFIIGGTALAVRRPTTAGGYYLAMSPALFHYAANAGRVAFNGNMDLLPVVPLYVIPIIVVMYHLYREHHVE